MIFRKTGSSVFVARGLDRISQRPPDGQITGQDDEENGCGAAGFSLILRAAKLRDVGETAMNGVGARLNWCGLGQRLCAATFPLLTGSAAPLRNVYAAATMSQFAARRGAGPGRMSRAARSRRLK